MKNLSGEDRKRAAAMLLAGLKPAAVAKAIGVPVSAIYKLKHEMKKAGQFNATKQQAKTAPSAPAKESSDEFQQAVGKEFARVQQELARLQALVAVYRKDPGKNGDFLDVLEKKIASESELLVALEQFKSVKEG